MYIYINNFVLVKASKILLSLPTDKPSKNVETFSVVEALENKICQERSLAGTVESFLEVY